MNNRISLSTILKFLCCFIFDVAIIIAFFHMFALFTVLVPIKSIFMLLFLLIGLVMLNGAIAFPHQIFDRIGVPYSASIIVLFTLYAVLSNVLSTLLIVENVVTYIVWELILLAAFFLLLSFLVSFAKRASENIEKIKNEQSAQNSIDLQLMKIETAVHAMDNNNSAISNSYQALKERINASTPFGRIADNQAVAEVENMIKANLNNILSSISMDLDEKGLISIQKLLDYTRQLVIDREKLIVK